MAADHRSIGEVGPRNLNRATGTSAARESRAKRITKIETSTSIKLNPPLWSAADCRRAIQAARPPKSNAVARCNARNGVKTPTRCRAPNGLKAAASRRTPKKGQGSSGRFPHVNVLPSFALAA